MAALVAIVVLALALMNGATASFAADPPPPPGGGVTLVVALAGAMSLVLWTYDGWSDVGAIAGEVRRPQRTLPRVYLAGTALVTGLYLAVNVVYFRIAPIPQMRQTGTIAPLVVERLLSGLGVAAGAGAAIVSLVILISTLGSTHGSIITGARISYAQARDGLLFAFLGRVEPRFGTPAASLWVQLVLALAATWYAGGFQGLASTFVFTMWIFYGLAGAVVFILRRRLPDAARPFPCPGYPWVPGLFVAASVAMTVLGLIEKPGQNLLWVGVLLAGAPVYLLWRRVAT